MPSPVALRAEPRRPLLALLIAFAVSNTGNTLTVVAVPWFVLQTTGSPALTGVAGLAASLPVVISATFAGVFVDRLGHRRAAVLSDLISAATVAAIPALYLSTGLAFPVLLALLFARWLFATPGETARESLLPEVASANLSRATGLYEAVSRGAQVTGYALAGALILLMGSSGLLFLDAATFGVSALVLRFGVPARRPEPSEGRYLTKLGEGFAFLVRDRLLRNLVIAVMLINMLDAGGIQVLLPVYARDVLHDGRVSGFLLAAMAVGTVAGNLIFAAVGARLPHRMTLTLGLLLCGAPRFLVMAVHPNVLVLGGTMLLAGLASGPLNPIAYLVIFDRVPVALRARVLGAITAGCTAAAPLGGVLAGALTQATDLTVALTVFGGVYLLSGLATLVGRSWRELDAHRHVH